MPKLVFSFLFLFLFGVCLSDAQEVKEMETLEEIAARMSREAGQAYEACPYSFLSKDYFARFSHNTKARPAPSEITIGQDWRITLPNSASSLAKTMAVHLSEFLSQRMSLQLAVEPLSLGTARTRHRPVHLGSLQDQHRH